MLSSANGDVIVTLLPQNTSLPWITPAQFRPELVPEELMAQGLTVSGSVFSNMYGCLVKRSEVWFASNLQDHELHL